MLISYTNIATGAIVHAARIRSKRVNRYQPPSSNATLRLHFQADTQRLSWRLLTVIHARLYGCSLPFEPLISRHHLTRHPTYRRDKLSRLAPPSELSEAHSPCRIWRLAGGRALGASFAVAMALILPYQVWGADPNCAVKGNIELFPTEGAGGGAYQAPSLY
jgi:hypothetical protein